MDEVSASPQKWTEADRVLRRLLRAAITRSGKAHDVAPELSQKLGLPISQKKLDEWTSESKARLRFPLAFALAFGEITGCSYELAKFVLGPRFPRFLLVEAAELKKLLRSLQASNRRRCRKKGRG